MKFGVHIFGLVLTTHLFKKAIFKDFNERLNSILSKCDLSDFGIKFFNNSMAINCIHLFIVTILNKFILWEVTLNHSIQGGNVLPSRQFALGYFLKIFFLLL